MDTSLDPKAEFHLEEVVEPITLDLSDETGEEETKEDAKFKEYLFGGKSGTALARTR